MTAHWKVTKMQCKVCGLEIPEQSLVVAEMVSPKLRGDGQVRLRLPFCCQCWRDPDRFDGRRSAFDAARREAKASGADALWKIERRILSHPPEAALPRQPTENL
jgi:hypothetical protein